MNVYDKAQLFEWVETHGIVEVLEALGEVANQRYTERRHACGETTQDDPEGRGWSRATKRILVLAKDLKHTYLRNVRRGLGVKEPAAAQPMGDLGRNMRLR